MGAMQNWLLERFNGRFNVITQKVELRKKEPGAVWVPGDNRLLKSLWRAMRLDGITCHVNDVANLTESDFSPAFNPFEDYLHHLKPWDGNDHIGQLSETVKTTKQELWRVILKKWLVGLCAGVLLRGKPNHIMPVLRSDEQGIGKTSWCRRLLPPEWQAYIAENMPQPRDKDIILLMSSKALILCDEMTQYERSADRYLFKAFMTQEKGTARAAYERWHDDYPRRASFIGTTNDPQFLDDPTGSRRFVVFDVTEIDYTSDLNYDGIYAQAMVLLNDPNFEYWLNADDIKTVSKVNEVYRVASFEEEMVRKIYEKGDPNDPNSLWVTSAETVDYLSEILSVKLQKGAKGNVGRAFHAMGCDVKWIHGNRYYCVRRRSFEQQNEINHKPME
ncbi:MAG: DUF3874 domain-containing protein [Bacteroidales bacterium]